MSPPAPAFLLSHPVPPIFWHQPSTPLAFTFPSHCGTRCRSRFLYAGAAEVYTRVPQFLLFSRVFGASSGLVGCVRVCQGNSNTQGQSHGPTPAPAGLQGRVGEGGSALGDKKYSNNALPNKRGARGGLRGWGRATPPPHAPQTPALCATLYLLPTVADNQITDEGAKAFAEALKVNSTLTQLNVGGMT